jgi:hypothetical protein
MARVKTVYSFVATTATLLDLKDNVGRAVANQIQQLACKEIGNKYPEFRVLYAQVEKENVPHMLGTGMAASPQHFTDAYASWIKSKLPHFVPTALLAGKNFFAWDGSALNPENRKEFKWAVDIYFDSGESSPTKKWWAFWK